MVDTQNDEARAIEAILEYVRRVENLKHKLAVFLTSSNRTSEPRECRQHLRLVDNRAGDDARKLRMLLLQECREALEVCERIRRPLDAYWSRHGLNADVPQVSSQRTTLSCGMAASPACTASQRRSSSAISS